jgi:hypothetical protein
VVNIGSASTNQGQAGSAGGKSCKGTAANGSGTTVNAYGFLKSMALF